MGEFDQCLALLSKVGLEIVVIPYEVVMATCNGERFLNQQIASILDQTVPPTRLLVSDDCSSDCTLQRLDYWQQCSAIPIEIMKHDAIHGRLGSCRNFERLLQESRAPYVMLADQDDIWDLNKAERLLQKIDSMEQHFGRQRPLLVHADLRLINSAGKQLAASFHRHQGLQPALSSVLDIGMQNLVTGCASLVNRACVEAAIPFPTEVVLHDWWLGLVAAGAGGLAYLKEPCISYRQHGANVVGALGWRRKFSHHLKTLLKSNSKDVAKRLISPGLLQLRAYLSRFGPSHLAADLNHVWSPSGLIRLQTASSIGLRKHGFWRTAGFYAALLYCRPLEG